MQSRFAFAGVEPAAAFSRLSSVRSRLGRSWAAGVGFLLWSAASFYPAAALAVRVPINQTVTFQVHAGDTVVVSALYATSDPDDPSEGEVFSVSAGFCSFQTYGAHLCFFRPTADGSFPVTGTILYGDGDEYPQLSVNIFHGPYRPCPVGAGGFGDCDRLPWDEDDGGDNDGNGGNGASGDPVFPGNGNVHTEQTDYIGPGHLQVVRSYNTRTGWLHSFLSRINIVDSQHVQVVLPDGRYFILQGDLNIPGNLWYGPATFDQSYDLVQLPQGDPSGALFSLRMPDNSVELYDADGLPMSIKYRDGSSLTFAHDAGLLVSAADNFGRSINFDYDARQRVAGFTTPGGRHYQYGYDGQDRFKSVTYPGGTSRQYIYENSDFPFSLSGIIDENNVRYVSWTYDAANRAITAQQAGGVNAYSFTYVQDYSDLNVTVTDPLGTVRSFAYTPVNDLLQMTGSDQPSRSFGRDVASKSFTNDVFGTPGLLETITDYNGIETGISYLYGTSLPETIRRDQNGDAAAEQITRLTWDVSLRLPKTIDESGLRKTEFVYDLQGNPSSKSVTDLVTGEVRTTGYNFNGVGQLLTVTDPRNNTTTYSYSPQGNLSTVTNALSQVTRFPLYDGDGYPTQIIDANGVETDIAYDARNRLITRTVAGATTRFVYDNAGLLKKVFLPDNASSIPSIAYTYDGAHRLTDVTDALGNHVHYTLDAAGNRTKEEIFDAGNALRFSQTKVFDALGQLHQVLGADGQVTKLDHNANGELSDTTKAGLFVTSRHYDELHRVDYVTDAANGVTHFERDRLNRLTAVIDPNGNRTDYTYDAFDDLLTVQSPDTGLTSYLYDAASNRTQKTDANGTITVFTYDELNRLRGEDNVSDNRVDRVYTYDGLSPNAKGHLVSVTSGGPTPESYSWNPRGTLASFTIQLPGVAGLTGPASETVGYKYDAADRVKEIDYPTGFVVKYAHDKNGHVTTVSSVNNNLTNMLASNIQYLPFGGISSLTLGNGVTISYGHDQSYRTNSESASTFHTRSIGYDTRDLVTSITDSKNTDRSQTFGYDNLERLTDAVGKYGVLGYTYDPVGNRLTGEGNTYTYTPGTNRLASLTGTTPDTFSYDAAGHIAESAQWKYKYFGDGSLEGVQKANNNQYVTSNEYRYSNGQRVQRDHEAGRFSDRYIYDQAGHLLVEMSAQTTTVFRLYVWLDDQPIAMFATPDPLGLLGKPIVQSTTGGQPSTQYTPVSVNSFYPLQAYYYVNDYLGTPQKMLTAQGAAPVVVWDAVYKPFGEISVLQQSIVANPLRLPGQYADPETNIYQNWHREYQPKLGRYLQSDPIGLASGPNTYAYSGESPTNATDPQGLFSPFVHFSLGFWGAVMAGMGPMAATQVGFYAAWTDVGTQSEALAYIHGMTPSDDGNPTVDQVVAAMQNHDDYVANGLDAGTLEGLGNALHAIQDPYAAGHEGYQPYDGHLSDVSLDHIIGDFFPAPWRVFDALLATSDAVRKWLSKGPCP